MPSSLTGRSTLSHHHHPIKQDAQQPPHFPGSAAGSKEVKMTREEESGNKSRRSLRSVLSCALRWCIHDCSAVDT